MQKTIPHRLNLNLCIAMLAVQFLQIIAMPIFLANYPWIMAAIILFLIPLNTPFWSLIHEAVHKNLHHKAPINDALARLMSVVFGASFDVLRFGHLMHHQYNRHWESEVYDENKHIKCIFWLNHYFKMLGGLYLTEVLTSFLIAISPLPVARRITQATLSDERHRQAVLNALLKPATVRRLRLDCIAIVLFYSGSFMLFGVNWPVLAFWIIGRGVMISLMDNAYHYGTPADNSVIAKELSVPKGIATFILNFNHHATHHRNVSLPWTELKAAHDEQQLAYTEGLGSALFVQFKGPIKTP